MTAREFQHGLGRQYAGRRKLAIDSEYQIFTTVILGFQWGVGDIVGARTQGMG